MTDDHAFTVPTDPADPARLPALHDRLIAAADREGLIDVAYRRLDSPLGPLLLAATDVGLVRVAFAVQDHDAVLDDLAGTVSPRVLLAPRRLDPVAVQLDEYFRGRRRRFDLSLDLRTIAGFRRDVVDVLAGIGFGATRTYAQVAAATGRPAAVRAVGTACARNPVPVVLGCHRVVRSDGAVGGYAGGVQAKRTLLRLEADLATS